MIQNDIEIDRIRAENAVKTRQLELRLDGLRVQISQLTALATSGKTQIEELTQELAACEARLLEREEELAVANAKIVAMQERQPPGAEFIPPLNEQHPAALSPDVEPGNPLPEMAQSTARATTPADQIPIAASTHSEIEKRVAHLTTQLAKLHQAGADLGTHLEQQRLATDQAQNRAARLAEQLISARQRVDDLEAQLEKQETHAAGAEGRASDLAELLSKEQRRGIRLCSKLKAKQALLREAESRAAGLSAQPKPRPADEANVVAPAGSTEARVRASGPMMVDARQQQPVADEPSRKTLDLAVAARMVSEVTERTAPEAEHLPNPSGDRTVAEDTAPGKSETDKMLAEPFGQFGPSPAST